MTQRSKLTDREKIEAVWAAFGVEVRQDGDVSYAVARCWIWSKEGALVKVDVIAQEA